MKIRYLTAAASALVALPALAADPACSARLKQALAAQGGEDKLRAIRSVSFQASAYRNMLEQSERPEGPYFVSFLETKEQHDHAHHALSRQSAINAPGGQRYTTGLLVADRVAMQSFGARQMPGSARDVRAALEDLALAPERVLLTALDAADTHCEADTILQGVPHRVLAFSFDGAPARIYLNAYTQLPTALDYSGTAAATGYAAYLGDVTTRTLWSFWRLDRNGVRYPMQWDIQLNQLPAQTLMLRELKFDAPADQQLAVPSEVAARFKPDAPAPIPDNARLGQEMEEIAPGVLQIRSSWHVAIVEQTEGLVIIEAPISSSYSEQVLAEAARRYPHKPVIAVVTSSDSWPHLAGIRTYAARGIPIYALDLSAPIVQRTLSASYASHPDALQAAPRKADIRLVSAKTVIGSGANRIELYPLRGETSERQLMAYLPERGLLYASDPFQRRADGSYTDPQAVSELLQAVAREHLQVERFFMMHVAPRPFSELQVVPGSAD
ncbi:hypothetical protein [Massilia sp. TS11]|uniref:hypothetical protein n=1 Tax=Massilia sp. TS11 TaxID=2908003 RepID=UPI001EDC9281|nr:hypothetical protein [Massilia sp. TS11]MCG2585610.1 hypothetical protein [Massilia sp. TS11]